MNEIPKSSTCIISKLYKSYHDLLKGTVSHQDVPPLDYLGSILTVFLGTVPASLPTSSVSSSANSKLPMDANYWRA